MGRTARQRLGRLLAGEGPTGSDSASVRLPADAIEVIVEGRPVTLPVNAAGAKRLIAAARQAQFGRGEETLADLAVRDTWELTPGQVEVGGAHWDAHLAAALADISDELGLPAGSQLRAELHSMLVYGKGQFFLPHQDSEKHDDMIATLVVSLPSVHSGGELVVDDRGADRSYRGSRDELVLIAFYADRRHQVTPVRSGYRVTLTYNLMLSARPETAAVGPAEQAARLLTEHFTSGVVSRYGLDRGVPVRLAFLLDHEYTRAGLRSRRFKGADAEWVGVLRAAAGVAGCECVLALAEIKETWDAVPAGAAWRRGGYYDARYDATFDEYDDDNADDDSGGDSSADEYELNELIDDEITLGWWVGLDGSGAETMALGLGDHEVCAVTPTRSLTPYNSEYEGYMGNYGNTVDRWYRRAAVVIWPNDKAFATRAEAGSAWALQTIGDRIAAGDLEGARADARSLEPFWRGVAADLLGPALGVAAGLRDASAARVVLAPFHLEMLTADHAPLLAALADAYTDRWLSGFAVRLVTTPRWNPAADRLAWVDGTLRPLCEALRERGAGSLVDQVINQIWDWASGWIDAAQGDASAERRRSRLGELGPPVARLLETASEADGSVITGSLATADDHIVDLLVPALRAHRPPRTAAVEAVARDCLHRLHRILEHPVRAADDWSIEWAGCGCEHCVTLEAFLRSPSERTLEWPLAKPGRQHVHRHIDDAGLPVRHLTRRQGRPYTLVLTKTEALFRQEQAIRRQRETDLEWVRSVFG